MGEVVWFNVALHMHKLYIMHIYDRICEKGSYTHIQFCDFEET